MNKPFPMLVFILFFAASCTAGKYTTYSFEPEKFHSLVLENDPSLDMNTAFSRQITDIAPGLFHSADDKVALVAPDKITINTPNLNEMVWVDAKVPVCIRYSLGNDNFQKMSSHFVFFKDIKTDELISVPVNLNRYDGVPSQPRRQLDENTLAGGTLVYNITYFTELPKHSAEYEVWVKIADIESNHVYVKIDLKENGKLITRKDDNR